MDADQVFGLLAKYVKELREGTVPVGFNSIRRTIENVHLLDISEDRREELKSILKYAFEQEMYIEAKQTANVLKQTESERQSALDAFLEKYQ